MRNFTVSIVTLSLFAAGACSVAESQDSAEAEHCAAQIASVDDLIARSSAIVLAEPAGEDAGEPNVDLKDIQDEATKGGAEGDLVLAGKLPVQLFSAIDYVKGDGAAYFSVIVATPDEPTAPVSHDSDTFWEDATAGRRRTLRPANAISSSSARSMSKPMRPSLRTTTPGSPMCGRRRKPNSDYSDGNW